MSGQWNGVADRQAAAHGPCASAARRRSRSPPAHGPRRRPVRRVQIGGQRTSPFTAASAQSAATASASSPLTAATPQARAGPLPASGLPARGRRRRPAAEGERTSRDQPPTLPSLCPATRAASGDGLLEHAVCCDASGENPGCVVLGQHEPFLRPSKHKRESAIPSRSSASAKRPPCHREGLRQVRGPFPPLRSLAREETDHPRLAHRPAPRAPSRFGRELSLPRSRRPFGRGRSRMWAGPVAQCRLATLRTGDDVGRNQRVVRATLVALARRRSRLVRPSFSSSASGHFPRTSACRTASRPSAAPPGNRTDPHYRFAAAALNKSPRHVPRGRGVGWGIARASSARDERRFRTISSPS